MHTALLVSPHVSSDCGQAGRSAQALLTFPAIRGLRQSSDSFPPWPPLPLPELVWGSRIFGTYIAHRGYIILLGPQEAATGGITSPPSLHSPSLAGNVEHVGRPAIEFLDSQS